MRVSHDADTASTDDAPLATDALLEANRAYADAFDGADLPVKPSLRVAIVACMDCRLDVSALLGLENGQAHVIRNAGGVVTDDVIRSLCLSQRALGTREIVLVHHTGCGLATVTEDGFRADLADEVGVTPPWPVEAFEDPYVDVRRSIRRLEGSPFVPLTDHVRGFVYDVATGRLDEVEPD